MADSGLQRVVAVDWSGDKGPGQRKKIWAGVWTAATSASSLNADEVTLESGRTRVELMEWLVELGRETPRMVLGVDFCFSYPEWFVREHGADSALEFWEIVMQHGEGWLAHESEEVRFWGRIGRFRTGKKPVEFHGVEGSRRMLRRADEACKVRARIIDPEQAAKVKGIAPKSPFQIGGAGAVGTGTLRGIPILHGLEREGFRVWPFQSPELGAEAARPLLVEIYPRLLTGEVNKGSETARTEYLVAKRRVDAEYRRLDEEIVARARGSEDAFDALVSVMAMVERRESFLGLEKAVDPVILLEGAVWGAGE